MAEQIAATLQTGAEDRSSPKNDDYRVARGQALMLADLLELIGKDPR